MKKWNTLLVLTAIVNSAWALSASAFAPTIFYGAGFFIAKKACPDLGITANESLSLAAEYTHFQLDKVDSDGFKPLLSFSVPDDGAYYFKGELGLQSTDEFMTNAFDGSENFHFKMLQSGDLQIVHSGVPGAGTCLLTNNSGG